MSIFEIVVLWHYDPWGSSPEEDSPNIDLRARNMRAVQAHLEAAELPFRFSPAIHPWSRSAARNAGALLVKAPVVVFVDADTIVAPAQIELAAAQAWTAPGLVYGYDLYLRLTADSSERMCLGEQPHWPVPEREIVNAPSMGCAAISLECFRKAGGFWEVFTGWGYEDVEFAQRCAALWPVRRVPGPAMHLWHGERRDDDSPLDSDPENVSRNLEISRQVYTPTLA